jgi:hypothetical protein
MEQPMTAITINRVPDKFSKELKRFAGSRSNYARKALAAALNKDGRGDLAEMLEKHCPKPPATAASN